MSWHPWLREEIEHEFAMLSGQVCLDELEEIGFSIIQLTELAKHEPKPIGRPPLVAERHAAATLFAKGMKRREIAKHLNVGISTVHGWLKRRP